LHGFQVANIPQRFNAKYSGEKDRKSLEESDSSTSSTSIKGKQLHFKQNLKKEKKSN